MPPFVNTKCTNMKCQHTNRYDLAELKKKGSTLDKIMIYRESAMDVKTEEFEVTCETCGQRFKFKVTGGNDG